jgi:hypothetical protein
LLPKTRWQHPNRADPTPRDGMLSLSRGLPGTLRSGQWRDCRKGQAPRLYVSAPDRASLMPTDHLHHGTSGQVRSACLAVGFDAVPWFSSQKQKQRPQQLINCQQRTVQLTKYVVLDSTPSRRGGTRQIWGFIVKNKAAVDWPSIFGGTINEARQ